MYLNAWRSRRGFQRFLACSGIALSAALALTACTAQDNIWARLQDSRVTFAVCDGISADAISVLSRARAWFSSSEDALLWKTDANSERTDIASGDLITYGVSPDEFTATEGPADFEVPSTTIVLSLAGHNSSGELVDSQYAVFDGSHLSADH
jgi:hypothetical protein